MKRMILLLLLLPLLFSCTVFEKTEEPAKYESVVFIGVDGAGSWFGDDSITGFKEIFSTSSSYTFHATSETPSISAQNWGSYLHGVSPAVHKCVNGSIACERFPYSRYPSVFSIIRQVYPDSDLVSFCQWNAINYGLVEPGADVYKSSDKRFCDVVHSQEEIEEMTLGYLEKNTPSFLFVHIEDADSAGHSKGYGSEEHLKEVQKAVDFIKKVDETIDYSKTLLIVATDHGGKGKEHGGDSKEEMDITIAVKGKTVKQSTLSSSVTPKDIAPVILKALGIRKPSFMEGEIPGGLEV